MTNRRTYTTDDEVAFIAELAVQGKRGALQGYVASAPMRHWPAEIDAARVLAVALKALEAAC